MLETVTVALLYSAAAMATGSPEVFGPYLVHERLGAGGMATVHRAVQTSGEGAGRQVALKRLLSQFAGDQEFVRGFVREARLASRLRHPNIAAVHDLGQVAHTYYIAMELVAGVDLRHVLRHIAYSVGPMPPAIAVAIAIQVCDALDHAHTFADEAGRPLGIVHRDVSPSNLLVGHDGVVKIIDFGIAKASSATLHTASGLLKGKFSYLAPEALDGTVDARGDLFALGVVLWELLAARPLFKGLTDFDTLDLVRKMDVPAPSTVNRAVPPELDSVVLAALARNPTQRWQSAAILRRALGSLAARPDLRAGPADIAAWIGWAMAQPAGAYAWDEARPAPAAGSAALGVAPTAAVNVAGQAALGVAPTAAVNVAGQAALGVAPTAAVDVNPATVVGIAPPPRGAGAQTVVAVHGAPVATAAAHVPPTAAVPAHVPPTAMAATVFAPNADAATLHVVSAGPVTPGAVGTPAPAYAAEGNPLANPEYLAAAAAFNLSEEQRVAQAATVVSLPEPAPAVDGVAAPAARSSWMPLVVIVLCAAAAAGGFFLVDALM